MPSEKGITVWLVLPDGKRKVVAELPGGPYENMSWGVWLIKNREKLLRIYHRYPGVMLDPVPWD